jgi:hypothetical protein
MITHTIKLALLVLASLQMVTAAPAVNSAAHTDEDVALAFYREGTCQTGQKGYHQPDGTCLPIGTGQDGLHIWWTLGNCFGECTYPSSSETLPTNDYYPVRAFSGTNCDGGSADLDIGRCWDVTTRFSYQVFR